MVNKVLIITIMTALIAVALLLAGMNLAAGRVAVLLQVLGVGLGIIAWLFFGVTYLPAAERDARDQNRRS